MGELSGIIKDVEQQRDQMAALFEQIVSVLRSASDSASQLDASEMGKRRQHRRPKASYPSNIARNIDLLRIECNWSYDDLAHAAGFYKATVLRHVNKSTKPHLETLKMYAKAFSAELGREISISDLRR